MTVKILVKFVLPRRKAQSAEILQYIDGNRAIGTVLYLLMFPSWNYNNFL